MSETARRLHDELLRDIPAGAQHAAAECPFCGPDAASETTGTAPLAQPGGPGTSDASQDSTAEGGTAMTTTTTDVISTETHHALVEKALRDATTDLSAKLESEKADRASADARVAELTEELEAVKADNARINGELDKAQIDLKAATDEVSSLKDAAAESARAAEIASATQTRSQQATNLGLFTPEYIAEKASAWAEMPESDWAARVEEWKAIKPSASTTTTSSTGDAASAMTGGGGLTDEASRTDKPAEIPARRAVLGLT